MQKTSDTISQPARGPGCDAPQRYLLGLIGSGIQASLSPAMHEREALEQGLRLHYQLIDLDFVDRGADALPDLVNAARAMGFAGLNITFPCKQTVIPLLDELSDEAAAIGAVNTIVFRDGRSVGYNTDSTGWRWGFERALAEASLARVVLLGAGGAGSAIAHALMRMECASLAIVDPLTARARHLAEQLNHAYPGARAQASDKLEMALQAASGLVHATPTGMVKSPGLPLPAQLLNPGLWVSEVVYFPLQTELLQVAAARGCRTVDGGGMAVGQAVGAFEMFTGRQPDAARMQRHFADLVAAAR